MAIEHVLAETSDPRAVGLPEYFNALQDTFQCNGMLFFYGHQALRLFLAPVSSRIVSWTSVASALLEWPKTTVPEQQANDLQREMVGSLVDGMEGSA